MGLEDRIPARLHLSFRGLDEWHDETVERILRAVVGVQRNRDRVVFGDFGGERGKGEGSGCPGLHGLPREVVSAAGGDLDDPIAASLGQSLKHGVDGCGGGDVERGEGKSARLGLVQHLCVLVWGRDWHDISLTAGHCCLALLLDSNCWTVSPRVY